MTALLYGKPIVANITRNIRRKLNKLKTSPCLATILIGDDSASITYVKMKINACKRMGINSKLYHLSEDTNQDVLLSLIKELNDDPEINGILLQHPIPEHLNEREAFDLIDIEKDVDGVTSLGFGNVSMNVPAFPSCTPAGIIELLDYYNIELSGKNVVVVGRSSILGKPVAAMLLNRDATVTVCHSYTENLPQIVLNADIVVAAVGKPNFIQGSWIKKGAVVIDAGYNEGNIGDVDFESCVDHVKAITPVPGGVGPVTIAKLMEHTVLAAEKKENQFV